MASSYTYNTPTGLIVPDTSATLAVVQGEYQNAFGDDLITTPDTPQGVLITTETIARNNFINNNAAIANQINPNYAGGIFLDAILALTGVQRTSATPTVVTDVTVTGIAGTTIPVGSQAQTAAGDLFETTTTVVIPVGGTTTVNFQSMDLGAIPCAMSALNSIVSAVLGWETVTNSVAGVVGSVTQSDQQARSFRQNTLFFQGLSLAGAIKSALYNVAGVTSLSFLENYNSTPEGALIHVTNGATLLNTTWGLTNTTGSGTAGAVVIGTDALIFAESLQTLPAINPWPVAKYTTTGNITLSALTTQGGGDWAGTMTAGDIVLVKNQSTGTQNGLYTAASGAWSRLTGYTAATQILGSNDGISLIRNSVYACVAGGVDTDVAAALLENKSSGAAWNGGTAVTVVEPASMQEYTVLFDRPEEVEILIRATVHNCSSEGATQAILDYANGNLNGFAGFVVGQDVSSFELAGAIMAENPGAYVSSVTIAINVISPSYSTNPIAIGLNQQAVTTSGLITITVS